MLDNGGKVYIVHVNLIGRVDSIDFPCYKMLYAVLGIYGHCKYSYL